MKLFYIFGTAAAGVLGYMAEPNLRLQLTGKQPSSVEIAENGKLVLQVDLASLTQEQLPQKITIHKNAQVSDAASEVTMTIQAGNKVKLIRVEAGNAVISPGEGPFIGKIPVMDTDLLQLLASVLPVPAASPVAGMPTPAGESAEPAKTTEPAPVPKPATVAQAPEVEPPAASPKEAASSDGKADVIKTMQESIKAAQVEEFTFEQVTEWTAEEEETVDGETYQTGLASYTAETIFGTKLIQAKALIKSKKVHRWIWPKSGMDIK